MNRIELIEATMAKTNGSKKEVEATLKAFVETIKEEISNGGNVGLVGFGTFDQVTYKEQTRIQTLGAKKGEEYTVLAGVKPRFKASKTWKKEMNKA